ncbi:MAG: DUF5723 family protein [Saprospiraceae bacterium]|nr:DUF5723 family protein [Saprospiraceae bacterium]
MLLAVFFSLQLSAQQELMLHSLPDVWHSTATNPAFFPEDKHFAIGLPGIGLDAAHSGEVSYKDIFVKSDGRTQIDFTNALAKLDPVNTVFFEQRIETASVGFRLPGKIWLQAGHANRLSGAITYPKTLPSMIWDGNAQYIGQTVDIALQTDISNWNEWSVGLAKGFGNFNIGARAKYLSGITSLLTDANRQKATITTSDDIYQLSLSTDYAFYSSSLISAFDTAGLGFDLTIGELHGKAFSKNTGFAFDLGVQYKVNEQITLDLAVLDLGGKITWKEQSNYFASQGDYQYDGVTLPGADIINGSDSLDFATKLDTLNDIFKFKKTAQEFETTLPLRGYLGGNYAFGSRWIFGLGAYFQKRAEEKATVAVGASARWKPLKWFSLGAMYSVNERSAANLGFHLVFKPGPVQLYFASDNVLNAFTVKSSPAVNFRTGLSLIF